MKIFMIFFFLTTSYISGSMMTGGWSEERNLESLEDHAKFAAKNVTEKRNEPFHLKLSEILHAEKQVVQGMNYKIEFKLIPTTCPATQNLTLEAIDQCPADENAAPLICTVKVWYRAWLEPNERRQMTHHSCSSEESQTS